ncbi:E3 ubiquitin-protein ligase TM129 [Venturia canescens]|uniref:E3 ubiquitin-protein ligase TM129 n=1 Tax=Venturia canescens TaxID=32260 RepID=UPI001C9C40D6|nr:E3 ubiquitin-protein ligase TM129 [Venturia canescens]
MSGYFFYTLFYILMTGCIIYPPTEFVSAGLTITDLFSPWLESEDEFFIQYHLKRSIVTLFVHSMLPFGYSLGLVFLGHVDAAQMFLGKEHSLIFTLSICALIGPMYTLQKVLEWSADNWASHPIGKRLSAYCDGDSSWMSVASDINREYRRIESRLVIVTNSVTKVVATDNWIIKVTPYKLHVAHQTDTTLIVNRSDTHAMSPATRGEVQYVNIEVTPRRPGTEKFNIRLNALDFKDLQDRVSRPITVLPNVTFHKTLLDRFIDTFKEQVEQNSRYRTEQELEQCVGCMQATSNVKLTKQCGDMGLDGGPNACVMCYCRPMWCIDCMAKWFATRQDENAPETWLSSKCMCPVCRAKFCILDVCYLDTVNQ